MKVGELEEISSDILKHVHITEEVLKHIKVDKSLGPDQVFPRTLWEAREEIAGWPLAEVFVPPTSAGEVPEDWRLANVPLFKKGEVTMKIDEVRMVDGVHVDDKAFDKVLCGRLVGKHWRLRGDLIEVYKTMRGMDRVNSQSFLPRAEESKTRGHGLK
eukprot:g36566.t1